MHTNHTRKKLEFCREESKEMYPRKKGGWWTYTKR
jgi:hypothetical protein